MKQLLIGTFDLGCEEVGLVVRDGVGGEFTTSPRSTIFIGIQTHDYGLVMEALLHEAFEFVAFRLQARYSPDGSYSSDHGFYLFSFTHMTFSDIMAKVARFSVAAIPALKPSWETYHSPRKKRR